MNIWTKIILLNVCNITTYTCICMINTTLHVHIQKTEKTLADVKEMFHFKDFINNATYIGVHTKGNYACIFSVKRLED